MINFARRRVVGAVLVALALIVVGTAAGPSTASRPGDHLPGTTTDLRAGVSAPYPPSYIVTFNASGLVSPFNWTVTLGTATESSTHSSVLSFVAVSNGTYTFRVTAVGEVAAPAFGSLTVRGASLNQSVSFSPTPIANPSAESSLPLVDVVALIGAIVAAVVAAVAIVASRSRRGRGDAPPPDSSRSVGPR
jgi:hypothetical protein